LQSNGFNGTYSNEKIVYNNRANFMTFYPMIVPLKHLKFVRLALQTYYKVDNFQQVFNTGGFLKENRLNSFDIMGNFTVFITSFLEKSC
jgi:hypothetical protein